jgi:hypothetical protein
MEIWADRNKRGKSRVTYGAHPTTQGLRFWAMIGTDVTLPLVTTTSPTAQTTLIRRYGSDVHGLLQIHFRDRDDKPRFGDFGFLDSIEIHSFENHFRSRDPLT